MKLTIIPEWRVAWRYWSLRLGILAAAVQSYIYSTPTAVVDAWNALPAEIKGYVPANYLQQVGVGLAIATVVSRIVGQPKAAAKHAIAEAVKEGDKANEN